MEAASVIGEFKCLRNDVAALYSLVEALNKDVARLQANVVHLQIEKERLAQKVAAKESYTMSIH